MDSLSDRQTITLLQVSLQRGAVSMFIKLLPGADFVLLTSNISFSSISQRDFIMFSIINDKIVERSPEMFVISVGPAIVSISITDNDGE
jgi:hypothetical protein